ncbi:cellulose biosynthesis cyclic di-GMP-binding regulatory protein BcsB [Shimia sp. SK013]|uniref:cellulose biosynthesis cyclic di-GMP-binding regulatory protein BcsB n=1 Tax=Shimia sp. SK013 TaxID=1389006 RepID=UPI00128F9782|nr:cellulose biosynthesis cyclic di-GMP-binding regulatory protein BcsB [Shimia sp. SK013]
MIAQRINPDEPIILSGLPAYQGATFFLPTDSRPTSGHLQLDVTVQVLAGVEGVLRVSIGNSRRADLLLRPGEAGRSLRIDLTTEDLTRERLVVSFSLQGESPLTPCGKDEGLEAVVEIETTSALFLALDKPTLSVRDRANMAGRRVALLWSNDPQQSVVALLAAHELSVSGWEVQFGGGADAINPETAVMALPSNGPTKQPEFAWSDALAPTSSVFGLRRFQGMHSWRIRYDLMEAQNPILPAEFSLDIVLGAMLFESGWQVTVTLNGRLIDQVLLNAGATRLTRSIDLSDSRPARKNVIEIVAWSSSEPAGNCNEGPVLLAELTSQTALIAGSTSFSAPLMTVRNTLAQADGRQIAVDNALTAPEAEVAVALLSNVLPDRPQTEDLANVPTVHVLPRGASLSRWQVASMDSVWMISFDENGNALAHILSDYRGSETTAVTLLVDLSEVAT